jgi:alpha-mannosidase
VKKTWVITCLALCASLPAGALSPGSPGPTAGRAATDRSASDTTFQAPLRTSSNEQLLERIEAEIAFARGLCELTPSRAAEWTPLVARAEEILRAMKAGRMRGDMAAEVLKAEKALEPLGPEAKQYTVHSVGHAHIDMNWMWPWAETVGVTNDTFTTVLTLMDEFPDFRFTQSQASVYALMKRYNPDLFGQIQKRVAEGRWEVAAVHWVEGDKNLASGEALAHHLLYTRAFMKENFNLEPEDVAIDWEPDTFGHAATLPSILTRAGVKGYYLCRGGAFEKPPVFLWEAPDGSRVLVNDETAWYLNRIGPHLATYVVDFAKKTGLKDWMNVFGVGDHGGGPTRKDIVYAREMNTWPIFPRWVFSTARQYYEILEAQKDRLPVIRKELNFEFTGCYTTQAQIKRFNRLGESHGQDAEAAAALAWRAANRPYPAQQIREAWIDVLFGQFHDILPGSGVRATREYESGLFQESAAAFAMVRTGALRAIADGLDTTFAAARVGRPLVQEPWDRSMGAGAGRGTETGGLSSASHQRDGPRAVAIFNPTADARSQLATVTVWDPGNPASLDEMRKKTYVVHTADGATLPAEPVETGTYWGDHFYADLVFPVAVPPLGYTSAVIEEGAFGGAHPGQVRVNGKPSGTPGELPAAGELTIENEAVLVRFDSATGGVSALVDKKTGLDLARRGQPLGVVEYQVERPRDMSAWTMADAVTRLFPVPVSSLRLDLANPYVASVESKMKIADSDVTVTYTLRSGSPALEIAVHALWLQRGSRDTGTPKLRMLFPAALEKAAGTYEIPFGTITRTLTAGEEVPSQRFADVSGQADGNRAAGLLVLNDSKYGHSLDGSTLAVTLIRSSFEPDPLPEMGEHDVRMAILPHAGRMTPADMIRQGVAFNRPLEVVATGLHPGTLPAAAAGLTLVQPPNVVVSGVKQAETGDDLVVRLYETQGTACTALVELEDRILGVVEAARETDLLERPLARGTARVSHNGFTVDLPAYGIATVRVRLRAR